MTASPAPPAPGSADAQMPLHQRLIACSIEILETEGQAALTLRAAARAAGVSHMAPYRHFADKDALLAAVALTGFEALRDEMAAAASTGPDAEARLRSIGQAYMAFALRRPALYRLMFGPATIDMHRFPDLARAAQATFACCADAVAECAPTATSSDGEQAPALVIATWALVHGLASLIMDGRITLPEDAAARHRLVAQVLEVHRAAFQASVAP